MRQLFPIRPSNPADVLRHIELIGGREDHEEDDFFANYQVFKLTRRIIGEAAQIPGDSFGTVDWPDSFEDAPCAEVDIPIDKHNDHTYYVDLCGKFVDEKQFCLEAVGVAIFGYVSGIPDNAARQRIDLLSEEYETLQNLLTPLD